MNIHEQRTDQIANCISLINKHTVNQNKMKQDKKDVIIKKYCDKFKIDEHLIRRIGNYYIERPEWHYHNETEDETN